jgi:hypothetical protein
MKYLKLFENYYKETSWSAEIDGKEETITIKEIEDYLKNQPIIEIPVVEIEDLCIHKDKDEEETKLRSEKSDLSFPIIISKDLNGKYNMILDGHHRLLKAINTNQDTIKAKVLDLKEAPEKYKKMFI